MSITTHIDPPTEHTAAYARVVTDLPGGGTVAVEAYGPRFRFQTWVPAEVNWPAIGSRSPQDARAFAELVVEAAAVAEGLAPAVGQMNRDAALRFLAPLTVAELRAAGTNPNLPIEYLDTAELLAAVRSHLGLEAPPS